MNICVIGTGYVGLVTGSGLAELGHQVVCVDIDGDKVAALREGRIPFYEEGLEELVIKNQKEGKLSFTTSIGEAVRCSSIVFIAVGTPARETGEADLSQVIQVAENLLEYVDSYKVIVVKSTVPVGTVELVRSILMRRLREGEDFDIVANPEFLREGKALYDFFHPTRIIIGSVSEKASQAMRRLYAPFIKPFASDAEAQTTDYRLPSSTPLIETDIASAQMIKHASNAFLATRISFANEIASICERVGADVKEVVKGMGYDPRIGHEYLEAGIGFGGPCLEKDLRALIKIAESCSYEPGLLSSVLEKNEYQVRQVIAKLKELTGYLLYRKVIAIFGLAFKAGTNDVRTSLSLRVIDQLEREGASITAHDPVAITEARRIKPNIQYCEDPYQAVTGAEALLILTDWPEFKKLDYSKVKERMASPNLVDGKNMLEPAALNRLNFNYRGIGRS